MRAAREKPRLLLLHIPKAGTSMRPPPHLAHEVALGAFEHPGAQKGGDGEQQEARGAGGDGLVLAHRQHEGLDMGPQQADGGAGGHRGDQSPLQVDAQSAVVLGTPGLPAQRVQRA